MRHCVTEGSFRRFFRINMNELMILCHIGKGINAALINRVPS